MARLREMRVMPPLAARERAAVSPKSAAQSGALRGRQRRRIKRAYCPEAAQLPILGETRRRVSPSTREGRASFRRVLEAKPLAGVLGRYAHRGTRL